MLFGDLQPFVDFDLPLGVRKVREVHHRGAIADGPLNVIPCFDFHQLHTGRSKLMIERIAMRFWMITSDFMPVRSGNCLMNSELSFVRMPARPD